jgi:hypothetical protein
VLNYVYYVIFCVYKYQGWKRYVWIFCSGAVEAGIGLTEGFAWGPKVNTWIAVVANTLMFASVLQKVVAVCKTKDYTLLPWPMSIVTIFCSTCWIVYVILKDQKYLLIPNVFGEVFGIMGIIIFLVYRAKALKNPPQPIPSSPNSESPTNRPAIESNVGSPKKDETPVENQADIFPKKDEIQVADNKI